MKQDEDCHDSNIVCRNRPSSIAQGKSINTIVAVHSVRHALLFEKSQGHRHFHLVVQHLSRQIVAYFRRLKRQPSSQHIVLLAASVIEAH
jgi:hypothetical protein